MDCSNLKTIRLHNSTATRQDLLKARQEIRENVAFLESQRDSLDEIDIKILVDSQLDAAVLSVMLKTAKD